MKFHHKIAAGTALGLLMATAQLGATPLADRSSEPARKTGAPLILAQAEGETQTEECPPDDPECVPAQEQPVDEAAPPAEEEAAEPAPEEEAAEPTAGEEAAPAADEPAPAPAEEEPAQPSTEETAPVPAEKPAQDEAAPAAEEEPTPPVEEPPLPAADEATSPSAESETEAAPDDGAVPPAGGEAEIDGGAEGEVTPPAEEQATEPAADEEVTPPAEEKATQPAAEEDVTPPAEEQEAVEPTSEEQAEEPAPQEEAVEPSAEEQPADEQPADEQPAEPAAEEEVTPPAEPGAEEEAPAAEETVPETAPEETGAEEAAPQDEIQPTPQEETEPALEDEAAPGEAPAGEAAPADEGEEEVIPADDAQAEGEAEAGTEAQAPVLDSQKEQPAEAGDTAAEQQPDGEVAPPPESDAAARSDEIAPEEIESITAEEGRRLDVEGAEEDREMTREERRERREDRQEAREDRQETREDRREAREERREERRERRRERREERRERRENARVIEQFEDNRIIIEFGDQVFIESPDYERVILEEDEVYYEELSDGRIREVIIRPNDVRVVTIRNRYGDIIRRSKIYPNGEEVVLVYVPERYYDEVGEFRDPAEYLPPLRLNIPVDEYILEAEVVEDPDRYYRFLEQPPITEIERTYSVEEVKRSARVRDTMRRIDLDTINFEFGSAAITPSEIDELEAIARAMFRMLEENPGEMFLIEGHTDAVGTNRVNLALSDRRAENVARALTQVYGIPPENLVTQGYGEQYLKVETRDRSRVNRRVAIRRITPLVSPVASAE